MDGVIVAASSGIAMAVIGNIVAFAYCYGKLSQKVDSLCHRVKRVEEALNHLHDSPDKQTK